MIVKNININETDREVKFALKAETEFEKSYLSYLSFNKKFSFGIYSSEENVLYFMEKV